MFGNLERGQVKDKNHRDEEAQTDYDADDVFGRVYDDDFTKSSFS